MEIKTCNWCDFQTLEEIGAIRVYKLGDGDKFILSENCFAESVKYEDLVYISLETGLFHKLENYNGEILYGRIVGTFYSQELKDTCIWVEWHDILNKRTNDKFVEFSNYLNKNGIFEIAPNYGAKRGVVFLVKILDNGNIKIISFKLR